MPGHAPVTRNTLRQQIADALRDEVLAGRLRPGQAFTVKEIADQYGVSATPVREALVDLSAQGVLEADQHRGFRVPTYSLDDYRGMLQARALVIDGMFQALLAAGGHPAFQDPRDPRTVAALATVRRRGEEVRRAAGTGDIGVLIGYDLRFWRELSDLFGNPYLADFLHRLRVRSWVYVVGQLRRSPDPDPRGRLWSGHVDLVDALARQDFEAARTVVADYSAHSLALVEKLAYPDALPGSLPDASSPGTPPTSR